MPDSLPKCNLINQLNERIREKHGSQFNYFGRLDEFRQRVTGEIRSINQLFPEFTPHDEEYHIKHLFHIADTILADSLNEFNSSELIILALSLYGHDWGMAVNEIEKEYITTGKIPPSNNVRDLGTLDDDNQSFIEFLKTITKQQFSELSPEIQKNVWREYVRRTHAIRSGEKVRRFFSPIDNGIAESVARVCESHSLSFEELDDENLYSVNFSVLGENVNLRAVAIYLRLIDLFDLSSERTPYVIWKFVAPRDPLSQMEWAKHRSLQEITCPQYQNGRVIRVDGSTNDPDVFAELEDLRNYCNLELRGGNDILARMNDPRHKLNIYHIDWRVVARLFKPISIRFEFDRLKMFEFLSSEIYEDDPYVFLRELLQNSIDAIRMRTAILHRKKMSFTDVPSIRVNVVHKENGDAVISWQDYGIGMDESIIRNYLAVAGKSYYSSEEFNREGLNFDPISRFGIGILSCFMVADKIEIVTYKEPHSIQKNSQPIRLTIPDKSKNFRIIELSPASCEVGTTVTVYVKGEKLPLDEVSKKIKSLEVTKYLEAIAGFCEYPIIISENGCQSIITHPKTTNADIRKIFGNDNEIKKINYSYPWISVFHPHDIKNAEKYLEEMKYDISQDLGVEGYEGSISFVVPKQNYKIINKSLEIGGFSGITIKNISTGETDTIKWKEEWSSGHVPRHLSKANILSKSGTKNSRINVFRDGILVPDISDNSLFSLFFNNNKLPSPIINVNIPKSNSSRINLARTTINEKHTNWFSPVFDAYLSFIFNNYIKKILNENPENRWYYLGMYSAYYHISPKCILKMIPIDTLVIPVLCSGKIIKYVEWSEIKNNPIRTVPNFFIEGLVDYITDENYQKKYRYNIFEFWAGQDAALDIKKSYRLSDTQSPIRNALEISSLTIHSKTYYPSIQFLKPPMAICPAIMQFTLTPLNQVVEDELRSDLLFEKVSNGILNLTPLERIQLNNFLNKTCSTLSNLTFLEFSSPYKEKFAYQGKYFNLSHPSSQQIINCVFSLFFDAEKNKNTDSIRYGELNDILLTKAFHAFSSPKPEVIIRWLKNLFESCDFYGLIKKEELLKTLPTKSDFVFIDEFHISFIPQFLELIVDFHNIEEIQNFGQDL